MAKLSKALARRPPDAITVQRFVDEVLPVFDDVTDESAADYFEELVVDHGLQLCYVPPCEGVDAKTIAVELSDFNTAISGSWYMRQHGYKNVLAESKSLALPLEYGAILRAAYDALDRDKAIKDCPRISDLYIWREQAFAMSRGMPLSEPFPWAGQPVKVDIPDDPVATGGLVLINSKPAVPVRAIPFVTHWFLDVADLPRLLSGRLYDPGRLTVDSFSLNEDYVVEPLEWRYWEKWITDFEELGGGLREREHYSGENRSLWEREALQLLPSDCLVWAVHLHDLCLKKDRFRQKHGGAEPGWRYSGHLNFLLSTNNRRLCLDGWWPTTSIQGQESDDSEPGEIRAVQRFQAQHQLILKALDALGHDPQQLPKSSSGRPGVRSQVWDWLKENRHNSQLTSRTNYRKVWQRMREEGELADKEPHTK